MQNLDAFWRKQSVKCHCAVRRWVFVRLHESLFAVVEDVVLIRSSACLSDLGQAIFYTTTCLLPFLSDDILSTLPYTMISTLATFPPFLHKDIIEYLSTSFLPMAICEYIWLYKCERCFFRVSIWAITPVVGKTYLRSSKQLNRSLWSEEMRFVLQWVRLEERVAFQRMSICLPPPCWWSPCSTLQIQVHTRKLLLLADVSITV